MALFEAPPSFNCNYPLFASSRNTSTVVISCSASSLPPPSSPKIPEGGTTNPNSLNTAPDRSRDRRKVVRLAWEKLVRWSRSWRSKNRTDVLQQTNKVTFLLFPTSFYYLERINAIFVRSQNQKWKKKGLKLGTWLCYNLHYICRLWCLEEDPLVPRWLPMSLIERLI